MIKNIIIGLVLILVVAGGFYYFWMEPSITPVKTEEKMVEEKPLKVGAILPLTGELAFVGEELKRGMELALADYPEAKIEIIFEDDAGADTKTAVNALNKLVNVDGVELVLNDVVNTIKALAPILNEKKIPGVVIWDNNKTIAGAGEYIFGMGFSTELAGEDMASFAYNKLGLRKVAVVSAVDEWSEIISGSFKTKFEELGGKVTVQEKTNVGTDDYRVNIAKIKKNNPEAIYFPLFPQDTIKFVKQAKELGYKGKFLSGDGLVDIAITELGNLSEGIYLTQLWLDDPEFLNKYKTKYGTEQDPTNLAFAAIGYDGVKIVAELKAGLALQNKEINSQNLRDGLVGFEFKGVTGRTKFSADRITDKREPILVIKNKKFELAK